MVSSKAAAIAAASATLALVAASPSCKPNLDERTSLVEGPRFLAMRAEPAEGAPLAQVAFTVLYVDPSGDRSDVAVDWAFCDDRKPLAELGPVSPRCLQRSGDFFEPIGAGATVESAIPQKACRQFGPDVPETTGTDPAGRPVDPDSTGGYYQPIRLIAQAAGADVFGLGQARITCGVAGANPDQLADLQKRNHPNTNAAIDSVTVDGGGALDAIGRVSLGQRLALTAAWSPCADGAVSCTGAEHYANYDTVIQAVRARTEAIRVSWFATDGAFDDDSTGEVEGSPRTSTANAWTAPNHAADVHMWIVIRDDRGGVGWKSYDVHVE